MERPSVYIETSIVSYLVANPAGDPVTAANQRLTHAWWNERRHDYLVLSSSLTALEAARGDPVMVQRRLALLAGIPECPAPAGLAELVRRLRLGIPLPEKARADAQHIALAAMNRFAYLLTWDTRHIANPHLMRRTAAVLRMQGFPTPVLCTPRQLMEVS